MQSDTTSQHLRGLTLTEAMVGVAIFLMIAVGLYQAYQKSFTALQVTRARSAATLLSNELFEIARNLPYSDVGIIGGLPSGKLSATSTIIRGGFTFDVTTTVRNIDDPFDGTIGGTPNDTAPADYKLVQLSINCVNCRFGQSFVFATNVGPKNLEGSSNNGAILIRVFDASGIPIPGANVHIENNDAIPSIVIDDTTNIDGELLIVDAPPGVEVYEISASKLAYSTDRTYGATDPALGGSAPIKPHATIAAAQVTQISFFIDQISSMTITSVTDTCAPAGDVDIDMGGAKLIGTGPSTPKFATTSYATDPGGVLAFTTLEWDTYHINMVDSVYDLQGTTPLLPLDLPPGANASLQLVVAPINTPSMMATIADSGTGLPLADATVELYSVGAGTTTLVTGRGFLRQTDWSGGAGQQDFIDQTRFFDSDGNIDIASPAGEVILLQVGGSYLPSAWLESSSFDTGSASNFYQVLWEPPTQPIETGPDAVRFQIATNNDNLTWNYLGPDGTAATFYTLANQNINTAHNGDRYIRYKLFLQTEDTNFTPSVAEVAFTFTSSCVPPGQVLFNGVSSGTYSILVQKSGYQTFFDDEVVIGAGWQRYDVILFPE
jgi:hypothetical protein